MFGGTFAPWKDSFDRLETVFTPCRYLVSCVRFAYSADTYIPLDQRRFTELDFEQVWEEIEKEKINCLEYVWLNVAILIPYLCPELR